MTINARININSQIAFLECLDENMVSELFQRAKFDTLENDLRAHIINDSSIQVVESLYISTIIGSMPYNPSIYITIHENGVEICHVSIHLCPSLIKNTKLKGPIHTTNKQTKNAVQRLHVNKQANGSFIFSLGGVYGKPLSNTTRYYTLKIIDVLNSYFNVMSPDYLGIRKYSANHFWAKNIYTKKQSAISEIRTQNKSKKTHKTRRLRK